MDVFMTSIFFQPSFMHMKMKSFLFLLLVCGLTTGFSQTKVLVFSKTAGFRHSSIVPGKSAIVKLGKENNFSVDTTEDAAKFTDAVLKNYNAVVFLNTTGDVLNAMQQAAFERFIQSGGGFMGIHAATDCEYNWPWYGKLIREVTTGNGIPWYGTMIMMEEGPSIQSLDIPMNLLPIQII